VGELALIVRRILVFLFVDNLLFTLILALGAAAIYWLLPRPRAQKTLYGACLGLLAMMLGGALLVGTHTIHAETLLFYAFSATAVIAGALLVTQRNPARAALSFALVVLSSCGLFLLLAAPFLMAATTIVYAGAIVVTFLFVLMLAQQEGPSDADDRSREPLLSVAGGFILLGVLLYVLKVSYDVVPLNKLLADTDALIAEMERAQTSDEKNQLLERADALFREYDRQADKQPNLPASQHIREKSADREEPYNKSNLEGMKELLIQVRKQAQELGRTVGMPQPPSDRLHLSELSGPASNRSPEELRHDPNTARPPMPAENTAYLGRSLFSDYLLAVELGGTLLLVATVGAIAIASRRQAPGNGRRQP
jgi:NADH:ubiquinone oxidoreductase subunit 6 (subunit J)